MTENPAAQKKDVPYQRNKWLLLQIQEASIKRKYCKFHVMMEDGLIERVIVEESMVPPK